MEDSKSKAQFVIVMGVSGSGKTSVGQAFAAHVGWTFYDADDFHSAENVAKMANGVPLTDEDRAAWLQTLHALIRDHLKRGESGVLACSALKVRYRDVLRADNAGLVFVYLRGDFALIHARMQARPGHYMQAAMLQSQFDALEAPDAAEALTLNADQPIDTLVQAIVNWARSNP
jgi:gluconokinase